MGINYRIPPGVMFDKYSVRVDIYTMSEGGEDDRGDPIPPQPQYYVQDAPADLQPKSGTQRAAESGTTYESTHVLFMFPAEGLPDGTSASGSASLPPEMSWPSSVSGAAVIAAFFDHMAGEIPAGAMVDIKAEAEGPVQRSLQVVFVANWSTHLEIDLKAV